MLPRLSSVFLDKDLPDLPRDRPVLSVSEPPSPRPAPLADLRQPPPTVVTFASSTHLAAASSPSLRRSPSFLKPDLPGDSRPKRRLSLGPTIGSIFSRQSSSPVDPKSKETSSPQLVPHRSPEGVDQKSVIRRPSFWSRKRADSIKSPVASDDHRQDPHRPSSSSLRSREHVSSSDAPPFLPNLRPASPLLADTLSPMLNLSPLSGTPEPSVPPHRRRSRASSGLDISPKSSKDPPSAPMWSFQGSKSLSSTSSYNPSPLPAPRATTSSPEEPGSSSVNRSQSSSRRTSVALFSTVSTHARRRSKSLLGFASPVQKSPDAPPPSAYPTNPPGRQSVERTEVVLASSGPAVPPPSLRLRIDQTLDTQPPVDSVTAPSSLPPFRPSNSSPPAIRSGHEPTLTYQLSAHGVSQPLIPSHSSSSPSSLASGNNSAPALFSSLGGSALTLPNTSAAESPNRSRSSSSFTGISQSGPSSTPTGAPGSRNGTTLSGAPPNVTHSAPPKPKPEEETPEMYLVRLFQSVAKAEIATVLASSSGSFYNRALVTYIGQFDFTSDALDVALRKLLMELSLPKETQQIDRVMEAFAQRYNECNPGLFVSEDHPYILAFSMMILHTDAFNKSNKSKMSKADYIKYTSLPGVPAVVLDCFFDNIVFAPFIFIEDPISLKGESGQIQKDSLAPAPTHGPSQPVGALNNGVAVGGSGRGKIDPYYLITRNLLAPLRADLEPHIPQRNPYLYTGTKESWNVTDLQVAFACAQLVRISFTYQSLGRRRSMALSSFASGFGESLDTTSDVDPSSTTFKVAKFGILRRKEDILAGGKRSSNRRWREWGVLLTGSQLLFLRDPAWIIALREGARKRTEAASKPDGIPDPLPIPSPPSNLHLEDALSLNDTISLYDLSYEKYTHTFRFVLADGRQYLLQAPDDHDMNEWIALINYASAFKTAGIRMRALGMTDDQAKSTGAAAAVSHFNDLRRARQRLASLPYSAPNIGGTRSARSLDDSTLGASLAEGSAHSATRSSAVGSYSFIAPGRGLGAACLSRKETVTEAVVENQDEDSTDGRLEDTFFEVKAELAAVASAGAHFELTGDLLKRSPGGLTADPTELHHSLRTGLSVHRPIGRAVSLGSFPPNRSEGPDEDTTLPSDEPSQPPPKSQNPRSSRSVKIGIQLRDLESKIVAEQSRLESDIRTARNIAVLSPFAESTRARLSAAILPLAKRISVMRMLIAKLVCHRDILAADSQAGELEWRTTLAFALSAAADKLVQRQDHAAPPHSGILSNGLLQKPSPSPQLKHPRTSLPDYHQEDLFVSEDTAVGTSADETLNSRCSTINDSGDELAQLPVFQLPTDIPRLTPEADAKAHTNSGAPPPEVTSTSKSGSQASTGSPANPASLEDSGTVAHAECENWRNTKAGKRVSLVSLPPNLALSTMGRRPGEFSRTNINVTI